MQRAISIPLWALLAFGSVAVTASEPGADRLVVRSWKTLPHSDLVQSVAFSPNGRLLATADGTGRLWDLKTHQVRRTLTAAPGSIKRVAFSPNDEILATGETNNGVRLWEPSTGKLLRTLPAGPSVEAIAFSRDGILLAIGGGKGVHIWQVKTGEEVRCLTDLEICSGLAFSPDGKLLVGTFMGSGLRRWDPATGRETVPYDWNGGPAPDLGCVAFSPLGNCVAMGSNIHLVQLCEPGAATPYATLRGHGWPILGVAFSPHGQFLASVQAGGSARFPPPGDAKLWDLKSRKELASFQGHKAGLACVAFSPDGKLLATGGYDDAVILWKVPEIRGNK